MKKNIAEKAQAFAIAAHDSVQHRRKYTDEPYHVHPARVAALVATVTDDEEMIAAAWLHDVLEDVAPKNPNFNNNAIQQLFGDRVLALVLELTDISKPEDGNRATRKALDREHLAKASADGKTIKLADMIDNMIDIAKHDPHFARVFRREAQLSFPSLSEGDDQLYSQLKKLIF